MREELVGKKAKGRISKWVLQEYKARQIFQKMNISYPLISACTYQGSTKCSFFGKFVVLCFACNSNFEIHPFDITSLPHFCDPYFYHRQ